LSRAIAEVVDAPDPAVEPRRFAQAVAASAAALGAAAVLPGSEDAMLALAGMPSPSAGAVIAVPQPTLVERVLDKEHVIQLAAAASLSPPATTTLLPDELRSTSHVFKYPIVLKPPRTKALDETGRLVRRHVSVVCAEKDLPAALAGLAPQPILVQPFIRGMLGAICGVAYEGDIVCSSHQVAERIWPANCGISSYAVTVPKDERRERRVQRLLELLGWTGIFQVQFIHTTSGAHFLELNPRIYGSLALAVSAGVNLPAVWADLVLGHPVRTSSYRIGSRYRAEGNDLRAIASLARRRRARETIRALRPRRHTVHAVFSPRDPAPALSRFVAVGWKR
jgi:predicted ATP-grasp superfamily ATP-dependent carboligase